MPVSFTTSFTSPEHSLAYSESLAEDPAHKPVTPDRAELAHAGPTHLHRSVSGEVCEGYFDPP